MLFNDEGLISKKHKSAFLVNTRFKVVLLCDSLWKNDIKSNDINQSRDVTAATVSSLTLRAPAVFWGEIQTFQNTQSRKLFWFVSWPRISLVEVSPDVNTLTWKHNQRCHSIHVSIWFDFIPRGIQQQLSSYRETVIRQATVAAGSTLHRDDAPTCGICHKTKFADGCGNLCSYCQTKFCARCGGRVSLRSNTVRDPGVCECSRAACHTCPVTPRCYWVEMLWLGRP